MAVWRSPYLGTSTAYEDCAYGGPANRQRPIPEPVALFTETIWLVEHCVYSAGTQAVIGVIRVKSKYKAIR